MRLIVSAGILIILLSTSLLRNSLWADYRHILLDTIGKSPEKARAYTELGVQALNTGDYKLAIDAFTRARRINPYLKYAYANVGLAYEGLNMPEKAIEAYERAISINPRDPIPYYNLGLIYYSKLKDRSKALALFQKARDLDPSEPDVHHFLARIYEEMGQHAKAKEEQRVFELLK